MPAAATMPAEGRGAPWDKASARLTTPATSPLSMAICTGIGRRELAREIVVDTPAQARSGDPQTTPLKSRLALPGKKNGAGQNRKGSKQKSSIDILPKHDPGDAHRRQAFQIQEQRCGGRIRLRQTKHQEQGAQHAAKEDHREKPRHIRPPQRRLNGRQMQRFARQMHREKADTSTEVEEAGHQPGTDRTKQKLGERRAGAKQHGRCEGERDARLHSHNLQQFPDSRLRHAGGLAGRTHHQNGGI